MFMENTIGSFATDKLKLSDFIDESFFEDAVEETAISQ